MSLVEHNTNGGEELSPLPRAGVEWDSFPTHLFMTGNARFWDPSAIDFSADAVDWREIDDGRRRAATYLIAQFCAGEEAVTRHIQPFLRSAVAGRRLGDEMYLSQVAFEKSKHAEVFALWSDAVGLSDDLTPYVEANPFYRQIFGDELPTALAALDDDPSPVNEIRALVTYHQVVVGSLALTGHHMVQRICSTHGILPGLRRVIRFVNADERRHVAWSSYTCRRLIADDDALWDVALTRLGELTPLALGMINWVDEQFETPPFGLDNAQFIAHAADRASRRLDAIAAARGRPVAEIDVDDSPEALEDTFGNEDDAALGA